MRPSRYAHIEGFTDLCYSDNGKFIITCGQDGDIRIFEGLNDDDCKTHSIADNLHAIAYRNDSLIVGSDMNMVHSFTFDDGESNGIIARFTATPTHIQISKDRKLIAAASSDMTIKILDEENYKESLLKGHEAPVLSIAFDPNGRYLASSSCDGTVKIWNLNTGSQVESLSILPKTSDFSPGSLCRLTWTSNGSHLVIPIEKEVFFYKRETWSIDFVFKSQEVNEALSIVTTSPCGDFIAAAGKNGLVAIWNINKKLCVFAEKHPKQMTITGISWNPNGQAELAFVNDAGELSTLENFFKSSSLANKEDNETDVKPKRETGKDVFPPLEIEDIDALQSNYEDEDEAEISLAKIKSQMGFADDEEGTFVGIPSTKDFPEETISRASAPPARIVEVPVAAKLPEPQKPFQAGMSPEHLEERYMLWNNVGIIRQYNNDSENSIEVEFHDSSVHHALHLNNHLRHSLAALSSQALALSAESQEDQPSKLVVDHFASWDGNKEWMIDMPTGEDILSLCIGSNFIAAATDKRVLRIFSLSGVQRNVLAIPGPVVCLSGHEGHLFVVFHSGIGVGGEQSMSAMILNLSGGSHIQPQPFPLPLSPQSFLSWAGFTDEGSPLIMDSAGIVRILQRKLGSCWAILLDTKSHAKGKSDNYFVLGASELQGNMRCILCKGSRYPLILPKPHVSLLDFKIPMCESGSERSILEDKMIKATLLVDTIDQLSKQGFDVEASKSETEKQLKEAMIKLFAMACRSEQESRGYDICQLMPSYQTVNLAIKYAGKLGRIHLANRLGELAEKKMEEELMKIAEPIDDSAPSSSWGSSNEQHSLSQESGIVPLTQEEPINPTIENPLLTASSRHTQRSQEKTQLLITPVRNPFKRASVTESFTKGITGLDSIKAPKKNQESHILRPVVKKPKARQAALQQAPLSFNKECNGKENHEISNLNTSVSTLQDSPKTPISSFKKSSALQLWYQDNKESVIKSYPDVPESALLPKAALFFKDVDDATKQKYKQLAAEANEKAATDSTASLDRKRRSSNETQEGPEAESSLPPEKKTKSTASKLASFAFNKD